MTETQEEFGVRCPCGCNEVSKQNILVFNTCKQTSECVLISPICFF